MAAKRQDGWAIEAENGEPLYFTESQELSELADYIEDYFTVK